jgi:hypothetical protein
MHINTIQGRQCIMQISRVVYSTIYSPPPPFTLFTRGFLADRMNLYIILYILYYVQYIVVLFVMLMS